MVSAPSEPTILERENDLFLILDWAIETKPNLSSIDFEEARILQEKWISQLKKKGIIRPNPIDSERVIYQCSSGRFLYLLKAEDLDYEGFVMGHCVGGDNFKHRVRNNRSIIISLRDAQNTPHVTIEVAIMKESSGGMVGTVIQQHGKGNKDPVASYHKDLREFALFSMGIKGGEAVDFVLPQN